MIENEFVRRLLRMPRKRPRETIVRMWATTLAGAVMFETPDRLDELRKEMDRSFAESGLPSEEKSRYYEEIAFMALKLIQA